MADLQIARVLAIEPCIFTGCQRESGHDGACRIERVPCDRCGELVLRGAELWNECARCVKRARGGR